MNKKNIIGFITFYVLIILVFSIIYYIIGSHNFNYKHYHLNKHYFLDCVYFSTVTNSAVGYGDITPKTKLAKIIVIIQILLIYTNFINFFIN